MKQRLKKLLIQFGLISLLGLTYSLWYQIIGKGIPCLFHKITNLYCPGCGVTRMGMSLIQLNFVDALKYNPCICLFLPILVIIGHRWSIRYCKTGNVRFTKWEERVFLIMIALLILFGILRNLPGMQMLRPE